ncbi:MAG: Holliday junction branch migration protein RuvA [Clostridia bacterium]|nr:Holliday junction branch migration protein RuvA [Clostridia bacterium]
MFYYLNGMLAHREANVCVIDCGGVGYKLTVSLTTSEALATKLEKTVKLYTHLAVREDGMELFGFATLEEREAFNLLIGVSGVGPKAATNILSVMTPDKLALAICTEDVKAISKAPNVGTKTAARIVLELKDKISKDVMTATPTASGTHSAAAPVMNGALSEAAEALTVLGYDKNSVLSALKGIDTSLDAGSMIKAALQKLAR